MNVYELQDMKEDKAVMDSNMAIALSDSLSSEVAEIASNVMEAGIDVILDDGILKEIPFVSTAVGFYKIGQTIRERAHIKNLVGFVEELNKGIPNEQAREAYKARLQENKKQRDKEVEYILLIIERFLHEEKAANLAKLYLEYLKRGITWLAFTQYAEVIDRFLPGDYYVLKSSSVYTTRRDVATDGIQRLIALGLVIEDFRKATVQLDGGTITIDSPEIHEEKERTYTRTEFGEVLVKILEDSREDDD